MKIKQLITKFSRISEDLDRFNRSLIDIYRKLLKFNSPQEKKSKDPTRSRDTQRTSPKPMIIPKFRPNTKPKMKPRAIIMSRTRPKRSIITRLKPGR